MALPSGTPPSTAPSATAVLSPHPSGRHTMLVHGAKTLVVGAVVAVFLSLLFRQTFWGTLLYSECIAISCWFFIDGGRALAARWVHRGRGPALATNEGRWPGWPWMIVCVVLGTVAGALTGTLFGDLLTGAPVMRGRGEARNLLALLLISLVPAIGVTYYFQSRGRLQAVQAQAEAAQRLAAENQLRLLESQLEPHMLFNTLANLRVLIGMDPQRAQLMLDRLIGFLRATLTASRATLHPLAQEFARTADYLALMKIRMGDRLQETLELPPELAQRPVPPLLLQPLVENAIKHGLEPHVEGGRLIVSARLEGDRLVLDVRDTGAGIAVVASAESGTGFGLQQVRERLATLYGTAADFELRAVSAGAGGGTIATVRLPAAAVPPPAVAGT